MVAFSKASTEASYGHTAGTRKPSLEAPRSTHGGNQVGHNGGITAQEAGNISMQAVRTRGRRSRSWRAAPRPLALFRGGTQAANHHTTVTKLHTRCSTRRAAREPHYRLTTVHTYKGSTDAAVTSGSTATSSGDEPHSHTHGGRRKSR
uniref:(northern house mosquito) hypothetical protein n=1 Tax=Culex pipiens TaxID=7175 RepID=A0A8D8CXI5_CULPI